MSGVVTPAFSTDLLRGFFETGTFVRGYTAVEFALTRKVPVNNASVAQLDEPVGGGYRRSNPYSLSNANWSVNSSGEMVNLQPILWPLDCTVTWGQIYGWAMIGRHATLPPVLAVGELSQPVRFVPPMRPRLPASSVSFGLYD